MASGRGEVAFVSGLGAICRDSMEYEVGVAVGAGRENVYQKTHHPRLAVRVKLKSVNMSKQLLFLLIETKYKYSITNLSRYVYYPIDIFSIPRKRHVTRI